MKTKNRHKKKEYLSTKVISRLKQFWQDKKPILKYVLIFGMLVGLFYIAYSNAPVTKIFFNPFIIWTAEVSSKILNLMGYQTEVLNDTIQSRVFSLSIKRGCDAVEPIALFVCSVIAFPGRWKNKLKGIIIGILILVLLNFIRIVSLFLFGAEFPSWFDTMHIEVWQVIFIISALILWMLWINSGEKKLIHAKSEKK